jgi:hypothetical protein
VGGSEALGQGTGYYLPPGASSNQTTQAPANVVAFDLGECQGRPAYLSVQWYFPEHGETFNPNKHGDICPAPNAGQVQTPTPPTTPSPCPPGSTLSYSAGVWDCVSSRSTSTPGGTKLPCPNDGQDCVDCPNSQSTAAVFCDYVPGPDSVPPTPSTLPVCQPLYIQFHNCTDPSTGRVRP